LTLWYLPFATFVECTTRSCVRTDWSFHAAELDNEANANADPTKAATRVFIKLSSFLYAALEIGGTPSLTHRAIKS